MFIRPNEFETQLAAAKAVEPPYSGSHRMAGSGFLPLLAPIMIAWLAARADFGGWLALR